MKDLVKFVNEKLYKPGENDAIEFPENADVIKISPNDWNGSLCFLTIDDIKHEGGLDKVLKLGPWESVVIDEDIYVLIIDPSALNEK